MPPTSPEVVRLFPTFVWQSQLEPACYEPLNRDLLAYVERIMGEGRGTGAGVAWQSGYALHREPELAALVNHIEAAVSDVLAFIKVVDAPFRITGCWANALGPGAAHPMHSHPNNFLSGVYYVQTQEGADTINFHDPRPQAAVIRPPVTALMAYNTDQVVITVRDGALLIFPAWLPHSVSVNASDRLRVSVSFNVMFASYDTTMSSPLWGEG
ncbi:2OG-Fe(II) oxygenase family protein [Pseudomonas sp. CR3202]|uniref:2OG-Fe(II) oxygenase family protein n=1 Tax=Pseudomonas sp. CR3202 TaxID=3351532 RepID=UPI003BF1FF21